MILFLLALYALMGLASWSMMGTQALVVALVVAAHTFEEVIWPGGFNRWINSVVTGDDFVTAPISDTEARLQGVALVIGLPLAAHQGPEGLAVVLGFLLADAVQHLALAYAMPHEVSPGQVTAGLLYVPVVWHYREAVLAEPAWAMAGAAVLAATLAVTLVRGRRVVQS